MLRALVTWWQSRSAFQKKAEAHTQSFLEAKLDEVDKKHTELSQELQGIKKSIEPLTRMIEEMRAPPEGFERRKVR